MGSFKDITGRVYGRLTVIDRVENDKHNQARWKCLCECGNYTVAVTSELNRGNVRSCGCLNREISKMVNSKHGFKYTRLYKVWGGIKKRCYNQNCKSYKNYGGKGITMCDEWKNDFKSFHDWAFANGYDENAEYMKCTIDRIDTNGNYEPSNCRWVDVKSQERNRKNNIFITYKNETHCIGEWAEILGINYIALHQRIRKYGWSIERAFTEPINTKG